MTKLEAIQKRLMKFCEPKPEYSGMFASYLASKVLNIALAENLCAECGDAVDSEGSQRCEMCSDRYAAIGE